MSQIATLTVTLSDKTGELSRTVNIRDNVVLTLSGVSSFGYADIRLAIILDGALLATCNTFDENYQGSLNLNTDEIIAAFEGKSDQSVLNLTWMLFSVTNATILNDRLPVQNNPWQDGMADPTPVEVVVNWSQAYTQAEADVRYVQKQEDLAAVRFMNGRVYHYIASTGLWYPEVGVIKDGVAILTLGNGETL